MDTVSGIGVLDKTVVLLDVLATGPVRLSAIIDASGISRATAHRLLQGMEDHGLVRRDDAGAYVLGLRLIGLGRVAADEFPLARVALPALQELQRVTGESAQLYVEDGGERLCVAAVDSTQELRTIVSVGARLPLGIGSAGRLLAGGIGAGGAEEWIDSVGERAAGVASVSAPVVIDGRLVAAVSISGPTERMTDRPGVRFGPALVAAARSVEAANPAR